MIAKLSEVTTSKIEKMAFILLNILVVDLCVFWAGRLIEFGPLTFRMILLIMLFVICVPLFLKNFKNLFKNNYIRIILVFAGLVIFSTLIGIYNNNRINLIITDIKGFVYFAFLPCVVVLINSHDKVVKLAKTAMYSAAIQAIIHMVFVCFYIANVPWLNSFAEFSYERRFFYIAYRISSTNVRITFLSMICLLFGMAFSIYFSVKSTKKATKIIYPMITAICGFSLLMTYTRSAYLAAAVTIIPLLIILFVYIAKKEKFALLKHLAITLIIVGVITAGFNIGTGDNYLGYGLSRVFVGIDIFDDLFNKDSSGSVDSSDDNSDDADNKTPNDIGEDDAFYQNTVYSDNLRAKTVSDLMANIEKSPIIGLGLGSEIKSRPDGLNEYFFLDLFSKMGIIGLICYLSPVILMVIQLMQLLKKKSKIFLMLSIWFCVLLGFITYSYFTPCMNSSVGILPYCCVMAVFNFYKNKKIDLEG